MCTSHINRKISYIPFDFWTTFRSDIGKYTQNVKGPEFQYLIDSYIEVFKILNKKCRLPSITIPSSIKNFENAAKKPKIYNIEISQEECWEDDENFNLDSKKDYMTLGDYRTGSQDVYYAVYFILNILRGAEGIQILFQLIFQNLRQDQYLAKLSELNLQLTEQQIYTAYIIDAEVALYSVLQMLDDMVDFHGSNAFLLEVIESLIMIPAEEIISKTGLQLIEQANTQIKYLKPEVVEKVFKFVLNNVQNPKIMTIASLVIKIVI